MNHLRFFRPVIGVAFAVVGLVFAAVQPAQAQPLGTYQWNQAPYCNVITLTITQSQGVFLLDGYDDQCGAARRASAVGIAFQNPDSSIGLGLTIVTTPGATPVHIDATVNLATISGTWRDSGNNTGAWNFTTGPAAGSPRPTTRATFPGGLSAGGATIAAVGTPTAPTDATNKAYVDAGLATVQAIATTLATTPLVFTANGSRATSGSILPSSGGCVELTPATGGTAALDLTLPLGASIVAVNVKYVDTSAADMVFALRAVDTVEGGGVNDTVGATVNSADSTGFHTVAMPIAPLPVVSTSRTYYLEASAPAHAGSLTFCGVQIGFAAP